MVSDFRTVDPHRCLIIDPLEVKEDSPISPGAGDDGNAAIPDGVHEVRVFDPGQFRFRAERDENPVGELTLEESAFKPVVVIVDLFHEGTEELTADDVAALKVKANGARRLVIAYMSIGEAEDYRYYWQQGWKVGSPSWLEKENPAWHGNYIVRYWDEDWQSVIYGNDGSYLRKILNAGFDGVYLDIIDAFEYFEYRE